MTRLLSFSIALLSSALLYAQAPLNKTVYDCNGNSRTIHDVLGSGKALIIAHKGVDCSICQGVAPSWQTWAAANKTKVEVWGAMTYKYNPNNFSPMCTATLNWKNTYNWTDIFTFPDSSRLWAHNQTPRYYVYSPIDSSIAWQGSSHTMAQSEALSRSIVGIQDFFKANDIQLIYNGQHLKLNKLPASVSFVSIYDLSGRLLLSESTSGEQFQLNVENWSKGTYFIQLKSNKNILGSKKVLFY
jgi:hypothetical protein